ncbi:MAG: hypothetical protein U0264_16360 [Candidatus Kapaibacterium sp.]
MKSSIIFFLTVVLSVLTMHAQETTEQVKEEYRKKIQAAKSPAEKLRLAKELQNILVPEAYQTKDISAAQLATMHDKLYKVTIRYSAQISRSQECSNCGSPCGVHSSYTGSNSLQSDFIITMNRNYSLYTAAGNGTDMKSFSASGKLNATSTGKGCSDARTCITSAQVSSSMKLDDVNFSFTYNANDKTWNTSINVPSQSHTECKGNDEGVNDDADSFLYSSSNASEGLTFTEKDGKFMITGTTTSDDDDAEKGTKEHTSMMVSITLTPYSDIKYDAYIVPVNTANSRSNGEDFYKHWLPAGRTKSQLKAASDEYGNSIAFKIKIVEKGTLKDLTTTPFQVHWKLDSVSALPGDCTNYPVASSDAGPDLRFDTKKELLPDNMRVVSESELESPDAAGVACIATVLCYDYGAYGKLTAHVRIMDAGNVVDIDAHLRDKFVPGAMIPIDENQNHIADEWENSMNIFGKNLPAMSDDEVQTDNENNGDGLTLFEEYRGMMIQGQHLRLTPLQKKLFVFNKSATVTTKHIGKFKLLTGGDKGIMPLVVQEDEIHSTMAINSNKTVFTGGVQHGVKLQDFPGHVEKAFALGGNAKAVAINGDNGALRSPKDLDHIWFALANTKRYLPFLTDVDAYIANTVAHEIAHACGVSHHNGDATSSYQNMNEITTLTDANTVVYDEVTGTACTYSECVVKRDEQERYTYDMTWSKENESSGDEECIMCYNSVVGYALYKSHFKKSDGTMLNLLIRNGLRDEVRNHFCNTQVGKLWNSPSHQITVTIEGVSTTETISVFGKAQSGGNCIKKFKVKDW